MMLCLQILARCKHDLIKKYSFSSGSWQPEEWRSCQWLGRAAAPPAPARCGDAFSHGFHLDFKAKPPKTWPEWLQKQASAFGGRSSHSGSSCQIAQRNCAGILSKSGSGWQQGCCHLRSASWDWVFASEISKLTSAFRPGTVDMLIATFWFKTQNKQNQYQLHAMQRAHPSE